MIPQLAAPERGAPDWARCLQADCAWHIDTVAFQGCAIKILANAALETGRIRYRNEWAKT